MSPRQNKKMSTGAIVGIVLACVGVALIAFMLFAVVAGRLFGQVAREFYSEYSYSQQYEDEKGNDWLFGDEDQDEKENKPQQGLPDGDTEKDEYQGKDWLFGDQN